MVKKTVTPKSYTHTGETVHSDSPAFRGPWTLPVPPRHVADSKALKKMSKNLKIGPASDSG